MSRDKKAQEKPPSAKACQPAPNLPLWETRSLLWRPLGNDDARETTIFVTIGYAPYFSIGITEDALIPLEIRYNSGYPVGSDLEALVTDICSILTAFLQHSEDIGIGGAATVLSKTVDLRHLSQESSPMALTAQNRGGLLRLLVRELQHPPKWAKDIEADAYLSHPDTDVGGEG